jgi:hypothetical protein
VRTSHTVLGYRYVRLDEDGRIVERGAGSPGGTGNRGIEIDFSADADRSVHKLFYFSINLSDEKMRLNTPFLAFLSELKRSDALLQSHLVHDPQASVFHHSRPGAGEERDDFAG